jgi:hypothetical protein
VRLYVNDRVVFFAQWSTWRGMKGCVTKTAPGLWVLIDGDVFPVAVSASEVVRDESSTMNLTGAE